MYISGGIFLLLLGSACGIDKPSDVYKLNIIHYNDFHARFEETSVSEAVCRFNNGSCLGGFPRLYHHINTLLAEKPDALLLNAGDSFQGTFWYTLLKWNITQEFMNLLPHDAHAIGNHEFDDGPEGLAPYLRALKAPVLAANMDTSKEPSFEGTYKPSIVVERNGRKIGIIGLTTVDTDMFSTPGNVVFTDPGEATKREAEALTKQGVDIIILLSHCGLMIDKLLAQVYGQYVDIIVGGHTHSLLWNGAAPSGEVVVDPYPVFLQSTADNKHKVLIVQASSFTKYMGNLSVYFDNHGDFVKWDGGPIFLNRAIPEDQAIKKKLEPYARLVHEAENRPVGQSLVSLNSADCLSGECGLGNLLADSIFQYAKQHVNPDLDYLAFVERGNIRSKIDKGTIRQVDIFDICPFVDRILMFELKGEHIKYALEMSISYVKRTKADKLEAPLLPQISGFRVTYNISRPPSSRVVSVYVGDQTSTVPLENDKYYHVLIAKFSTYLSPVFGQFRGFMRNVQEIGRDQKILEDYVRTHSPVNSSPDGRIVINY